MDITKTQKGDAGRLDEVDESTPIQPSASASSQPTGPAKGTRAEQNSGAGAGESKPIPASDQPKAADMPKSADNDKPADNPAGVSAQNDADAVMGLNKQIQMLQETAAKYKPESDADRKKREKKEKRDKMWAAIGDGLQSLSNLFFTTKGAPNMYNHKTMSQQTPLQKRLEEAKAEREANSDKYLNYSLKVGDLENQKAKTLRELEAQREAQRLAREKADREKEAHGWAAALQPSKLKEQEEKANRAASEAVTAGEEAKYAPELYKEKVNTEKARGTAQKASANASNASAAYSRAKGTAVNPYKVYNKTTKKYEYFPTKDSAVTAAQQYGTAVEVEGGSTTKTSETPIKDRRGKVKGTATSTSTSTSKRVIPASRETVEDAADNTPPSRRKNNDNRPPSRR